MIGPTAESIRTARLTLEPLAAAYAEEMVDVLADPRLYAFIGGSPPTPSELRERYRRWVAGPPPGRDEGWLNWVFRQDSDRRLVGTVQATVTLGPGGPQAAVAWVVGAPWQGRGLATEAVRSLIGWLRGRGIATITASIHPAHAASAAVACHAGLRPTEQRDGDEVVWMDTTTSTDASFPHRVKPSR